MIVSEFIEWLKTQDQEAVVKVLLLEPTINSEIDAFHIVDFNVKDHQEYTDMRENPYAKSTDYEGRRTLFLGNLGDK